MKKALVLGGDSRQLALCESLEENLVRVCHITSYEKLCGVDTGEFPVIILPVPTLKNGKSIVFSDSSELRLCDFISGLKSGQRVFGGTLPRQAVDSLNKQGAEYIDLLSDEDFLMTNAFFTAQGALCLLLESTDEYIVGKRLLITGFGRVASTLARLLSAVGCEVYISARNNSQLNVAAALGYKTVKPSLLEGSLMYFDYIFQTVPAPIFSEEAIKKIRGDCIFFELASFYGYQVRDALLAHNKRYVNASALPGRYLAKSAGRLMAECILKE